MKKSILLSLVFLFIFAANAFSQIAVSSFSYLNNLYTSGGTVNVYLTSDIVFTNNLANSINPIYITVDGRNRTINGQNGGNLHGGFNVGGHNSPSSITIKDITMTNMSKTDRDGASIWVFGRSQANLSGTLAFSNNYSNQRGGAIDVDYNAAAIFSGGTTSFTNNAAVRWGGALSVNNRSLANFDGMNVIFTSNRGTRFDALGGAIYVYDNSALAFYGSQAAFTNNISSYTGGAIYAGNNSSILFSSSNTASFTGNVARSSGAAIALDQSRGTFNGGISFVNNISSGVGGAMYVNRSSAAFTKTVVFRNNRGLSSGGGIYALNSFLDFSDAQSVTFSTNSAVNNSGGAVYMLNSTALFGGTVLFEGASSNGLGGAISAEGSMLDFTAASSTVFNKNTGNNGGAIYGGYAKFGIKNTFINNIAANANGGAISGTIVDFSGSQNTLFGNNTANNADGGALSTSNGTFGGETVFSNNSAKSGGAVTLFSGGSMLFLSGSTTSFTNNIASANGGAIDFSGAINVDGSVFFNGNKAQSGGALRGESNLVFNRWSVSEFKGNQSAAAGGAISFVSGNLVSSGNMLFENNYSSGTGGAADLRLNSTVYFSSRSIVDFNGNISAGNGGAISSYSSSSTFSGPVTFSGNRSGASGGAFYSTDSSVIFNTAETVFLSNSAQTGGAFYSDTASNISFRGKNVTFSSNSARSGGSFYALGSNVIFNGENAYFRNNKATGANAYEGGGAMYAASSANISFTGRNVYFNGNTSAGNGGALYLNSNAVARFTGGDIVVFSSNSAANGGAINIQNGATLTFDGKTEITGNIAAGNGGAINISGAGPSGNAVAVLNINTNTGAFTASGNTAGSKANDIYMNSYSTLNLNALNFDIRLEGGIKSLNSAPVSSIIINKTGSQTLYLGNENYVGGDLNIQNGRITMLDGGIGGTLDGKNLNIGTNGTFDSRGIGLMSFDSVSLEGFWNAGISSTGTDKINTANLFIEENSMIGFSGNKVTGQRRITIFEYGTVVYGSTSALAGVNVDNTLRTTYQLTDTGSTIDLFIKNIDFSAIKGITENGKQVAKVLDTVYEAYLLEDNSFWNNIILPMDSIKKLSQMKDAQEQLSGSFIANAITMPSRNLGKNVLFNRMQREKWEKLWGEISFGSVNYKEDDNVVGDFSAANVSVYGGADLKKENDYMIGVMAGYNSSSLEQNSDTGSVSDLGVGGYIGYFKEEVEVRGMLRLGYQSYDLERDLKFFRQKAKSDFSGFSIAADVEAGYKIYHQSYWDFKPFLSLGIGLNTYGSINESGSDASLKVDGGNYMRMQTEAGIWAGRQYEKFNIFGDIGLGVLLLGNNGEIAANLTGKSMTIKGTEQGMITGRLGVGGEYDVSELVAVHANLGYKISSGTSDFYGTVGASYKLGYRY